MACSMLRRPRLLTLILRPKRRARRLGAARPNSFTSVRLEAGLCPDVYVLNGAVIARPAGQLKRSAQIKRLRHVSHGIERQWDGGVVGDAVATHKAETGPQT